MIFASIAFFMFESGSRTGTLLYVALGAGLMGIWSATLFGSGGAIQWQRWQGTLEILVGAPPPFLATLLPLTVATSTIGVYSVFATLLWGASSSARRSTSSTRPARVALPATVLSLGMLGLLLASTFVLYRNANAFSNLLEYPVWLATGLLVPLTLLPGWVAPIAWVLSPTWGMRAIREAALGGNAWPEIGSASASASSTSTSARSRSGTSSASRAAGRPSRSRDRAARASSSSAAGSRTARSSTGSRPGCTSTTMLGSPLFQILFFAYLGRYAGSQDDSFFIVGNAIQIAAMAGIYGMTMGIANERQYGTLQPLSRRRRTGSRSSPAARCRSSLTGSSSRPSASRSWLLLDFRPAEGSVPALALAVFVTTCSCVALGMLIGSIGLRARDVFFGANLVYFLMLLVCGVNIPNDELPGWLGAIGRCLPLTHGIEAAREIAAGAPLGDVSGLLLTEALIGLVYATAAYTSSACSRPRAAGAAPRSRRTELRLARRGDRARRARRRRHRRLGRDRRRLRARLRRRGRAGASSTTTAARSGRARSPTSSAARRSRRPT